jgi:branched-subunit amino acid ABC-type transport system permease component
VSSGRKTDIPDGDKATPVGGLDFYLNVAVIGLAAGAVYAVFGLGITMIYKATRVPNFAHAAVGMVGAYAFFKTWDRVTLQTPTVRLQIPFTDVRWVFDPPALPLVGSLVVSLAVVALLGLFIERFVMRSLSTAPTLTLIIVTIALFTVITGLAGDLFSQQQEAVPSVFPQGLHSVGGVNFSNDQLGIFVVTALLAVALAVFFRYTTLGVAIRATADSREVARLLGIDANRVAGFSWAVGSMLAGIAGILISPSRGLDSVSLAGLIVYGFTAALFGGFTSLVGTLAGGLFIGALGTIVANAPHPGPLGPLLDGNGAPELVTLVVVIGILMLRPRFIFKGVRLDEDTGVSFARSGAGLNPEDLVRRSLDRRGALTLILRDWPTGRLLLGGMIAAVLLLVPVFTVSYWSTVLAFGVIGTLTALSVVVLTGWTGQIGLAPLTFVGVGAFATGIFTSGWGLPFFVAIPLAGLLTVPFAVVVGVPALRLRGFYFALATLAFAFAGERWLFFRSVFADHDKVDRGVLDQSTTAPIYFASLGVALLLFLAMRNLRTSRVARTFYAIRDSETTAQAMGINPVGYKLLAFAVSGFIAGVAGALTGFLNPTLQPIAFGLQLSLGVVVGAVVSGVNVLFGAVLAGFLFSVLPQLTATPTSGVNQAPVILAGVLAIRTMTDYPNGLASFLQRLVRPFEAIERVAWSTDEDEGVTAAVAISQSEAEEEAIYERAVHDVDVRVEVEEEDPVGVA